MKNIKNISEFVLISLSEHPERCSDNDNLSQGTSFEYLQIFNEEHQKYFRICPKYPYPNIRKDVRIMILCHKEHHSNISKFSPRNITRETFKNLPK
ncbi:hypothetical protein CEXT_638541 [Caerostris extrusa]|uniref:Uncharacterized protein n=1 Tax=Caerostris extrusa TaxID=172846 RepID=A0AAV4P5J3_CAEEX|nr:hypothetical protein CEXT_638541 [Caerostris extrusa]